MDTKEIDVIKNHRPICLGPFFQRRSIGPLPSCFLNHSENCGIMAHNHHSSSLPENVKTRLHNQVGKLPSMTPKELQIADPLVPICLIWYISPSLWKVQMSLIPHDKSDMLASSQIGLTRCIRKRLVASYLTK